MQTLVKEKRAFRAREITIRLPDRLNTQSRISTLVVGFLFRVQDRRNKFSAQWEFLLLDFFILRIQGTS